LALGQSEPADYENADYENADYENTFKTMKEPDHLIDLSFTTNSNLSTNHHQG